MLGSIKQLCDEWLEQNDLAEDDGDDENDENFEEEESVKKAEPLQKKRGGGRKKIVRADSQLDAISKLLLGKMFHTPLGKAHHRMSQWSSDKGPDEKKNEIKEGFRIELAKHLDGLRDKHKRTRDPMTKEYYDIADTSDLISAALIKVSEPACG